MKAFLFTAALPMLALLSVVACGDTASSSSERAGASATAERDFAAEAADFECLQSWTKVRSFRITNKLGDLAQALEVADSAEGGKYPVGTIIQLVPTEAMVKRAEGFSPDTQDWEFFSLSVSAAGTEILARGKSEVVNQFGLACFDCHSAADPKFDLVCETDHGCAPLPLPTSVLVDLQDSDPRCQ